MKVMNALEAKRETEKNIAHHSEMEIEQINNSIKNAIAKGQFQIWVKGTLQTSTVEQLKRAAYNLSWDQREAGYTINWSDVSTELYDGKETTGYFKVKGINL